MSKIDIIFYSGVIVFLVAGISVIIAKFEKYQTIEFKEHYKFIISYIILLILLIFLWKNFCDILFSVTNILKKPNPMDYVNG